MPERAHEAVPGWVAPFDTASVAAKHSDWPSEFVQRRLVRIHNYEE